MYSLKYFVQHSRHWLRSAVIQVVGCCCLDGYGVQGVVWSNSDNRKVTARYLYMHPTTQLLFQGAGSQKCCSPPWCAGLWVRFPERASTFHLQSCDNDLYLNTMCPFWVCCSNLFNIPASVGHIKSS